MCKVMEDMRNTAWNEGKIEGRIEGKIEGRIEGKMEGRIEGIKENAVETAKNLIKMGLLTFEQISQATKLPVEQVKELAGT